MNIEKKGTLTGTQGWVAEQLKDAKLVVEKNYIMVVLPNGKYQILAGVNDDENYYFNSANVTESGRFWYANPDKYSSRNPYGGEYLFDTRLTKKAKEKVEEFIADALRELINIWEEE